MQKEEHHALCVEVTFDALPEVKLPVLTGNSHTRVSTRNAQSATSLHKQNTENLHWYALCTTKTIEHIIENNGETFWPTIIVVKRNTNGKKLVFLLLLSNPVFRTFYLLMELKKIKNFVYDNVHLPFLRFYYQHHIGNAVKKTLIVPDKQVERLRIICNSDADDIKIVPTVEKRRKYSGMFTYRGTMCYSNGRRSEYIFEEQIINTKVWH